MGKQIGSAGMLALLLVFGARAALGAQAEGVQTAWNATGLSSLQYMGHEFLDQGKVSLGPVQLVTADGKLEPAEMAGARVEVDAAHGQVREQYAWGKCAYTYKVAGNRLSLEVQVTNTGDREIGQVAARLMALKFPRRPAGDAWAKNAAHKGDNTDTYTIIPADFKTGVLVACNDEPGEPLQFGFGAGGGPSKDIYPLEMNSAVTRTAAWDPVIKPGQSATWRLSVRFGPAGSRPETLGQDVLERLRTLHPFSLNWPDRRPIGMLMMAADNQKFPGNPRGWFKESKIDIKTDEGRALLRKLTMAYADRSIKVLKEMDAQGMIVWDIDGGEFPHATTYLGSPNMIAELAPEMDALADEYFKKFTEAGLVPGACIRPSKVVKDTSPTAKNRYRHSNMNYDLVANLDEKITYAKKRWAVRIFYMDTNVTWTMDRNGKPANQLLRAEVMKQLHQKHPDVLIVPEFARTAYHAYTSAYHELRPHAFGGYASTPESVLQVYPKAFSVLNTNDGQLAERHDDLVRSVRRGDALLFRGWFPSKENTLVKQIVEEAKGAATSSTRPAATRP